MQHALIIDSNMIECRAIQRCLEDLGFSSFDQAWTEAQALDAARQRTPDLIVIGEEIDSGCAIGAAREIAGAFSVPVLMVSGDPIRARKSLSRVAAFDGPFLLNEIDEAVDLARSQLMLPGSSAALPQQPWQIPGS